MSYNGKIGIIGSGSWATALAKIITRNSNNVHWWIREKEIIKHLGKYKHNPYYLSSVEFNLEKLNLSNNINDVVKRSDVLVLCYPAPFLYKALENTPPEYFDKKIIISAIKGIVPENNLTISEYLHATFPVEASNFALISGPSHSEEVSSEKMTFLTIASESRELVTKLAPLFKTHFIEIKQSADVEGIEFSAVLKNIYAIGAGIAVGLGYGDNMLAAYAANALKEIKYFLAQVFPNTNRHVSDSVYLGDLLVTIYSKYSRNRLFGNMIGKGYSVKSAQMEMKMIAEGYYAIQCIQNILIERNLSLPIVDALYKIVYQGEEAKHLFKKLARDFS